MRMNHINRTQYPNEKPFSSQDSFFRSIYIEPLGLPVNYKTLMTGDWGSERKKLADKGFNVGLSYTNNILGNPSGGVEQGFAYTDSIGLNVMLDFEKMLNWKGSSFYLGLVQRDGPSLTNDYIQNQFNVSQIYGGQNFRVDNMYYDWSSPNKRLSISLGRLNAGDYFLQSPLYYSYISNAYDGNPVSVFYNTIFSAYPNAQWGSYAYYRPTDILATKFAIFNTNRDVSQNRFHGLNFSFHGNNGVLLITEWDLLNNRGLNIFKNNLPGRYNLGFMYFTGKGQTNFLTQQKVKGNYGLYYQLEQKFYQPDNNALRGLSGFFEMSLFPDAYNQMPFFYLVGLIDRGIIKSRAKDLLTLGFAYGAYSDNLRDHQRVEGLREQTHEANIELNYKFYIKPWFFIQPGIQYVIRPKGYIDVPNAFVAGAQMSIDF